MPNARFEGVWDELVFDHDLKADLIWMMTNILRFSKAFETHKLRRKLNPLILLHGPPGTGKTSLCLGLAQKISIRLSSTYKSTKLIQIKTAVLLSKYYSESAKHVDEIFNMIIAMCEERPDGFICVLIDEVESIASSREFSTQHGESLDSMRATNALLTGLDRTTGFSNVVFLFTSNMCDALEPAFLDRCGLREFIGPPSIAEQYEILRSVLERLIICHVIQSAVHIPQYNDAVLDAMAGALTKDLPGPKLLEVVKLIHVSTGKLGPSISGRSLGQLPEKALMRYLRGEECDLDLALGFLRRCVLETLSVDKPGADDGGFKIAEEMKGEVKKRDWNNASDSLIETEPESVDDEADDLGDMKTQDNPDASTFTTTEAADGAGTKRKLESMKPGLTSSKKINWFDEGDHGKAEKRTKM
ncbi:AAA-domain-containing protein [Cadophora sp. DSE1049]|nr:AAA-domain-containing protein [Cadophora sp. DSE1049]